MKGYREMVNNLTNDFAWMDSRSGVMRDSKESKGAESYKGHVVEGYDHQRPGGTWHINDETYWNEMHLITIIVEHFILFNMHIV